MKRLEKLLAAVLLAFMFVVIAPAVLPQVRTATTAQAAKKPKLSATNITLKVGKKKTIQLKNIKLTKKNSIKWHNDNAGVVRIKSSKNKLTITAKKPGIAYITAKFKKKTYKCRVFVKPKKGTIIEDDIPDEIAPLAVSNTNLTISKKTTVYITYGGMDTVNAESAENSKSIIDFELGDWEKIKKQDRLPLTITPVGNGKTTITVTNTPKKASKLQKVVINVTVKK